MIYVRCFDKVLKTDYLLIFLSNFSSWSIYDEISSRPYSQNSALFGLSPNGLRILS